MHIGVLIIILVILLYSIKYYNLEEFEPASTQITVVSGPKVSNPIIYTPMLTYWYNPLDYFYNPYIYYNWNSYYGGGGNYNNRYYNTRYYNHRNKFRTKRHHK